MHFVIPVDMKLEYDLFTYGVIDIFMSCPSRTSNKICRHSIQHLFKAIYCFHRLEMLYKCSEGSTWCWNSGVLQMGALCVTLIIDLTYEGFGSLSWYQAECATTICIAGVNKSRISRMSQSECVAHARSSHTHSVQHTPGSDTCLRSHPLWRFRHVLR